MEAVAGFVVEAALSAAFDALFRKLSSQDVFEYARRNNVESEIKKWSKLLRKIKYVLDDAEERQMGDGPIKIWLDELRDLAYDVEDILDEFSTEVLRQKVTAENEGSTSKVGRLIHTSCSCFSPREIKFNVSLGSKMKEITQRFEAITREKKSLGLKGRATKRSKGVVWERLETTCLVHESQVYGRKNDKQTLVNELLSGDSNGNKPVSVVAIVGMGGLGKTTLAQLVYNDKVCASFDKKAWVCVSDEFDVFKITKNIIKSFTSSTCDEKDLNNAQTKLKDVLNGNKFLLILDDVWNEDYMNWDALSQPFDAGKLGSKVLITARNENVATTSGAGFMQRLRKLDRKQCLSVLAQHAFGVNNFSGHPTLQRVGEEIAEKCDGLPLAAKAIGGLLRGKLDPSEWEKIHASNMWSLKCPVLPALRVSYNYLPSHLKRCFAYCAMFPKDYEFDKNDLVLWWMAEGLLDQSKLVLSNFTKVGDEYFEDLLSRSFFQRNTLESSKFVMHDLINDLAIWVSEGMSLHLDTYEGSQDDIKLENLRHLSFASCHYEFFKRFEKFLVSVRLRSFLVLYETIDVFSISSDILDRLIPKMRCLKLLCLSGYAIKELPDSISNLKQLRHLDMSSTFIKLLPESICGLLNLQVLKLRQCRKLIELPREIWKLINLRVLDIWDTDSLKAMPLRTGHLKNLQILSKFIVGEKHEVRLNELKGLLLLRGELSIWGLEKVVDVQEARDANLKAKEGLVSIEFKWMEDTNERQIQILDELQPCNSLKSLKIEGYNGKAFPKWVGDFRFAHLETLSLRDCKSASSLPPLGGLVSLKKLEISGMHGVTKLGKEFYEITSSSNQTFPSVETLILKEMNGLEEWCSCFGNEEAEVTFPRLQKMEIIDCPVLVGKLPNNLPLLEELTIRRCPNLRNLKCRHPSLRELCIEDCSEAALKTLGDLTSLRRLRLINIREMIYVEDELLSMLGELRELRIDECKELKSLARRKENEIEVMTGLENLNIVDCGELENFGPMRLPSSLKRMEICYCKALKGLPDGFMVDGSGTCEPALKKLTIAICQSLETFPCGRFPDELTDLRIYDCENLESMPEFSNSIVSLRLHGCSRLRSLPRVPASVVRLDIKNLTSLGSEISAIEEKVGDVESELDKIFAHGSSSLETLEMKGLNMRRLPETLTSFHMITYIEIWRCLNLCGLPKKIHELKCLLVLKMEECPNLELFVGQELPPELEQLTIRGCERLIGGLFAGGLSLPASLTDLAIDGGSGVLNIIKTEAPLSLPKLQRLWMSNIGNVESLDAAFQLPSSCTYLSIERCPNMRELQIHRLSSNLGRLEIRGSPALQKRCLDRKGDYWPLISAIPCVEIEGMAPAV